MTRYRRRAAEDGSALVFALIFVGVWSIVILAVLSFAEAGFNLSAGSTELRDDIYAADGAVEAAITRLSFRDWYEDGPPPASCDSYTFLIEPEPNPDPEAEEPEPVEIEVEVTCSVVEPTNPRVVDLSAQIDGDERLRARVTFDDGTVEPTLPLCDDEEPPEPPDPEGEEEEEEECDLPPEPVLPAVVTVQHWQPMRVTP